jgi:phosphoribosylformylglycinamidine synthase
VVAGISHYGNCFGVPTIGGECVFEPCYNGNPLVNVFALGVFRHDEFSLGGQPESAIRLYMSAPRPGRDGIHGASMASAEFTEESKQKRPQCAGGRSVHGKALLEACIEAMHTGAWSASRIWGRGIDCSTCEMGQPRRNWRRDPTWRWFRSANPA